MSEWEFKAARCGLQGKNYLIDLSRAQKKRVKKYAQALEIAALSTVSSPTFSRYFVRASIGAVHGALLRAGNIEYGLCQALHAEEAAVAAFRAFYGRDIEDDVILGVIAKNSDGSAEPRRPCGNCRDIMLEEFGEELEIVCGSKEGGVAVVTRMSDYLFENFRETKTTDIFLRLGGTTHSISSDNFSEMVLRTVRQGRWLVNDGYSPSGAYPERKYLAMIVAGSGRYFGAFDVMTDYHPIYPLRDAIRQARRARDPFVRAAIIVCEDFGGGPPHVMYKDRQHLLELNEQQELISKTKVDPPVYLVTHKGKTITGVWRTSVKEWIPIPFSISEFGQEFIDKLAGYFRNQGR